MERLEVTAGPYALGFYRAAGFIVRGVAQLSPFDEQLAVLEHILGPLAQWSSKWAEPEELRPMRHESTSDAREHV